jgi:DNA integrity scanning protein DisA with diadenylate cyclase activity
MPRAILVELAALDGAVVLDNTGRLLAYGAVLEPRRRGRVDAAEGSRTKAAIGASNYGLAVKISADGDITLYADGDLVFRV